MAHTLVNKLVESFDQLDRCIHATRSILETRPNVPGDVINRLQQYSDIVQKQRETAVDLQGLIAQENWEEVARRVKIINGLSAMIRDDAQEIIQGTEKSIESSSSSLEVIKEAGPGDHTLLN